MCVDCLLGWLLWCVALGHFAGLFLGSLVFGGCRVGAAWFLFICRLGCFLFSMIVKIFSWNVRGLNNPTKRNAVRLVVSSIRGVVVCLQETKV